MSDKVSWTNNPLYIGKTPSFNLGKQISQMFDKLNSIETQQNPSEVSYNFSQSYNKSDEAEVATEDLKDDTTANTVSDFDSVYNPDIPTAITGTAVSAINSTANAISNNSIQQDAKLGNSQYGHEFYAQTAAENQINHNNTMTGIENSVIGISSLMGPEGLAAGIAVAGTTAIADAIIPTPSVSINTTSGGQIDV